MKITTALFYVLSLTSGISSFVEAADGAPMKWNRKNDLAADAAAVASKKKKQKRMRDLQSKKTAWANMKIMSGSESAEAQSAEVQALEDPSKDECDGINGVYLDIATVADWDLSDKFYSVFPVLGEEDLFEEDFTSLVDEYYNLFGDMSYEEILENFEENRKKLPTKHRYACLPACDETNFEESVYAFYLNVGDNGGLAYSISVNNDVIAKGAPYSSTGEEFIYFSSCGHRVLELYDIFDENMSMALSAQRPEEEESDIGPRGLRKAVETARTTRSLKKTPKAPKAPKTSVVLDDSIYSDYQLWAYTHKGYLVNLGANGCLDVEKKGSLAVTKCNFEKYDESKSFEISFEKLVDYGGFQGTLKSVSNKKKENPELLSYSVNIPAEEVSNISMRVNKLDADFGNAFSTDDYYSKWTFFSYL